MRVVLIEYNAGNIQSVLMALRRIGIEACVTSDIEQISQADRIIFPGVGEASSAMKSLRAQGLDKLIPQLKQPVLGICLGLQLMCSSSDENDTQCLGIFPQQVKRFSGALKVPHMGWNSIEQLQGELWQGMSESVAMYFVHSYRAEIGPFTVASSEYGERFSAALARDNFWAVQFHPEKSALAGQRLIENFIRQKNADNSSN